MTLIKDLASQGVKYVFVNHVDVRGQCRGKLVPTSEATALLDGSLHFSGFPSDGLNQQPNGPEVAAIADLRSLFVLPWANTLAWVPSSLHQGGREYASCSRVILRNVIDRAQKEYGFDLSLGIEPELYLLRASDAVVIYPWYPDEPRTATYNLRGTLALSVFADAMVSHMNCLGWKVRYVVHEEGPSQLEFVFTPADPLVTADRYTFFRFMAAEVARGLGMKATFMPKPFSDQSGSAAHFNLSLGVKPDPSRGANRRIGRRARGGLSDTELWFIGGILRHASAICAITCPTVNSYKRLPPLSFPRQVSLAPRFVCYGFNNRTALIRVPDGRRIEVRMVDGTCNPYLAAAFIIAAGLDGVAHEIDPGPPQDSNVYPIGDDESGSGGFSTLPMTLLEAVRHFNESDLAEFLLGRGLQAEYGRIKMREWESWYYEVSDWERRRYLSV